MRPAANEKMHVSNEQNKMAAITRTEWKYINISHY